MLVKHQGCPKTFHPNHLLYHPTKISVRTVAGFGNPPNKATNQRAKAMNNILAEVTDHRKVEQAELHELVETNIVERQLCEMTKAIYGNNLSVSISSSKLDVCPCTLLEMMFG